jgi:membrane protein YqaA with SNARE-associated domain
MKISHFNPIKTFLFWVAGASRTSVAPFILTVFLDIWHEFLGNLYVLEDLGDD